jgi:hypothetical protein
MKATGGRRGAKLKTLVPLLGGPAIAFALLLTSCGSQASAPQFVQAFGVIESPCAIGVPASDAQHCVADVLVQNQGGEGYGHLTIVVQVQDTRAGSAPVPPVKCGTSIPDTPAGGYADLACNFDLAAGQSVATYPMVKSIDFVGMSSQGSSNSDSSIATLILTAAAALLALASLIVVTRGRGPASAIATDAAPSPVAAGSARETPRVTRRAPRVSKKNAGDPDAEYNLPQMPR